MIYEFMPTQSYNGYDKPWAGGAGINILDPDTVVVGRIDTSTGAIVSNATALRTTDFIPTEPGTAYYLKNVVGRSSAACIAYYDADKHFLSTSDIYGSSPRSGTKTTPADCKYIRVTVQATHLNVDAGINYPATETDYYPYANICPPEGFNIWDPINAEYIQVYAGYVNANTRELYLRPVYPEYAGEELVGPWMSSLELYDEDATPTEGAFVIDFGGELESFEITPFMLQTLLDSLGIRQHFTNGAGLLNSLMDQAQGRVRSEEELLHLSRPLNVIAIGDQLPAGITFKPISKDVLPGLPGKFIR